MSQITNVVTTEFRARGGNQVTATMGSYAAGMGRIGQSIGEATRMSEKFGQTWRAVGTTVRYAIAGSLVFGLKGVVDQLKEIQQQAGLISAIGTLPGGQPIVGKNLSNLMAQARSGAVESITPLQDFNNAIINILSTVANVPENKIVPIATEIAKAAKLAQINAEDATKAFTTMNVSFGKRATLANIHRTAQEFFILTKEAPGGAAAGQQIITQLGQLAAVTRAGGGTQEDIFSLYLSGLRGGIPPAQLGRGLQYLIQTVALPGSQSVRSKAALGSVGIRPGVSMTLQQRLSRIFGKARGLGLGAGLGNIRNMDEDTLAQFDALGDQGSSAALKQFGISGKGAEFLGQVFPRIHALRAALAIQTQLDAGQAQKDFKTMQAARDGHVKDIDNLAKAWKRFSDQAKLQSATIALSAMGQQVAQTFAPILNLGAGQIVGAQHFLAHHAKGTSGAAMGIAGLGLSVGIMRMLGINPLRGFKGGFRGMLGLQAVGAELTGGGDDNVMKGLGNHPSRPLFVYVVNSLGPLSDFMGGKGLAGAGRTAGAILRSGRSGTAFTMATRAGETVTSAGLRTAAIAGGTAAAGALIVPFAEAAAVGFHPSGPEVQRRIWEYAQSDPKAAARYARKHGVNVTAAQVSAVSGGRFFAGMFGGSGAASHLEAIRNQFNPHDPTHVSKVFKTMFENIKGKAYVTMDVNLTHPGGKQERKIVHIPMDLWGKTGQPPSNKGNSTSGNRSR